MFIELWSKENIIWKKNLEKKRKENIILNLWFLRRFFNIFLMLVNFVIDFLFIGFWIKFLCFCDVEDIFNEFNLEKNI